MLVTTLAANRQHEHHVRAINGCFFNDPQYPRVAGFPQVNRPCPMTYTLAVRNDKHAVRGSTIAGDDDEVGGMVGDRDVDGLRCKSDDLLLLKSVRLVLRVLTKKEMCKG